MQDRIVAEVAAYRGGAVPASVLRSACEQNAQLIYGSLGQAAVLAMPQSRADGADRAARGVALADVMAAYRVGAQVLWEELAAESVRSAVAYGTAIGAAQQMWQVLDVYTQEMTSGYREALAARAVADAEVRAALIAALLSGDLRGPQLAEAASSLRLSARGDFVSVVLTRAEGDALLTSRISAELERRGMRSVWSPQATSASGIVVLSGGVASLSQVLGEAGVRAGVSPIVDRLELVPESMRLARLAHDGSSAVRRVVVFDNEPVAVTVATAAVVMPRITQTVLGDLLACPEPYRSTLLMTFWTWATCGGDLRSAAGRLFVHPNTVRYRLRRVEKLTGRSLSDPRGLTELTLAVEHALATLQDEDGLGR
ncbi:PucR family transcriptional regulator [Luethyella okanaganae]|uniref:PucR family transcriptional regulator n=1 Tax=Luethyella okanaganae TaxID=69372 RepID=A0ABW1VB33_9MICO